MNLRPLQRLFWYAAAAALLVAAAVWLLPARSSTRDLASFISAQDSTVPLPAPDVSSAEEIAVANIFSATRTPPRVRYVPPELGGDSANGTTQDSTAALPMLVPGMDVGPKLFGTVVRPDGAAPQALLQLDPAFPQPRFYSVGDKDGGYRVISIRPRTVVLRGPRGRLTLRLDTKEDRP